jgi:tripartite ATP-independent transporter DctM subunit
MSIGVIFLIFVVLMILGVPIAFCLGLASLAYISANGMALSMIPQKMTTSLETFIFVALPLFILAGDIMNTGGITQKLVNMSKAIVGRFKGGLAYVNVLVSMFFGGIQGMAAADTVAIGSLLIPAMKKEGYDPGFSTAITVASSCIGAIIPPSFLFIIFGASTGMSIGAIFLAGIMPGILLGVAQMAYVLSLSLRKKTAGKIPAGEKISFKKGLTYILQGLPTMVLPILIIGGITTGIVTTTESAVLAVVYAIAYCFITKETTVKEMARVFFRSVYTVGSCMIILCTSSLFGYILTAEKAPQRVVAALTELTDNKYILLIIIIAFLLAVGTFMDATPAVLILSPVLLPVMSQIGMAPTHIAVVVCFALVVGLITPPVGSCLYLASGISGLSIEKISKAVLPLICVNAIVLILVTYIPFLTTWIPSLLGG